MNTDYLLRQPSHEELRLNFGSLDYAYRVTGGSIPKLCYLLANPRQIPVIEPDESCDAASGVYARELKQAALQESITAAFQGQKEPTLAETARRCAHSVTTVRKILMQCALWPHHKASLMPSRRRLSASPE